MNILTFADLHTPYIEKIRSIDFNKYDYDICFTLGDINFETLSVIQDSVHSDIYAVLGNHDEPDILDELRIKNIDKTKIQFGGVSFVGLSGSSRYKVGNQLMLSQRESINICKKLEPADILISHDCAFGLNSQKSDKTHCGLKGISKYIKRNKPIMNIHGHHHENKSQFYKETIDICVFGCSVIKVYRNGISDITRIF